MLYVCGGHKRKTSELKAGVLISSVPALLPSMSDLGITVCGPAKAARLLKFDIASGADWLESSRIAAIAGSCPRSQAEVKSSVRAYSAFALKTGRVALPPTIDMLLSWSCLFRCSRTFMNYVSNLRTACEIAGLDTSGTRSSLLHKAVRAIDKRRGYVPRPPMFIGFGIIQSMVRQAAASTTPGAQALSMLFLMTYVFLLRLPSECLPLRVADHSSADAMHQSVVIVHADRLTLRLGRRKNKEGGSELTRKCWCSKCKLTCPVHTLGPFFMSCGAGSRPFAAFDASGALAALRHWLGILGVRDANKHRTHDIRRGHARDLQQSGASLMEILRAGEWRSAAFLAYMDKCELECDATLEAHLNESSDEDCE